MRRGVLIAGFSCAFFGAGAQADEVAKAGRLRIMNYNVENLFDTVNDATLDDEFTPGGAERWTESVLKDKIQNLSEVVRAQNPDVIGLVEIENQAIAERFVKEGLAGLGYRAVAMGTTEDPRGIRNAIVSRFPIVSVKNHNLRLPSWGMSRSRDMLEVTVDTGESGEGGKVTFFVNHWPSRRGGPERALQRRDSAEKMELVTDDILKRNPGRRVIAMGDFNDELGDDSLKRGLDLVNKPEELMNAFGLFFAAGTENPAKNLKTFFYHKERLWNSFDHVLVAGGEDLNRRALKGYHYINDSMNVVKHRFVESGKYPQGCESFSRRHAGNPARCLNGASDHFPVVADFEVR
jgi:endonuclease/exonuclease/phosphatase family metal-dependent hydrolase